MEKVRKVSKRLYLRQFITLWLACWMFFGLPAQVAMSATPVVTNDGGATITQGAMNTNVLVNAPETVIEWGNFNTIDDELVAFQQGSLLESAVLNRISGGQTSFYGDLTGETGMRIFLINPAGILFGDTATVNVTQLVASGLAMSNTDFQAALADSAAKMVFSGTGESGNVQVDAGAVINATNSVYLVGQNIANAGTISCPGGLVVMAAGDSLSLGQPGSSVIVDLADFVIDPGDNNLNTSGAVGAQNIALGASDIWASALTASGTGTSSIAAKAQGDVTFDGSVLAEATGASPATATIDIIAGGNVGIYADVEAKAIGDGVDNADATTTVVAGDNVEVEDGYLGAFATTLDESVVTSGNLTALVDIDAGKEVDAGDSGYPGYIGAIAKTGDYAYGDVGDITAKLDIDAGTVNVFEGNIGAIAKTGQGSNLNAGDITATVEIDTVGYEGDGHVPGDIYVDSYEFYIEDLDVDLSPIEAHAEAGSGVAGTAGNVTATVDIGTNDTPIDGMLTVDYEGGISAEALVGYQNYAETGNLTATVDVDTSGDVGVYGGWIEALAGPIDESPATFGDATATVNIDAGKNVFIDDAEVWTDAYDGATNTATTNVTANDGAVEVTTEEGYAEVSATAQMGVDNIANVNITAKSENVEGPENAHVLLQASDAEIYVGAEALHAENSNSAAVNINADYNVDLDADDGGGVYAEAYAQYGWGEGPVPVTNNAGVTVNAGTDVDVTADWYSNAGIYAEATDGVDNTADIDVTANDGYVNITAYEGYSAGIEAYTSSAENNNTATVDVTAKRINVENDEAGNVYLSSEYDSEAYIGAYAEYAENSNSATTTINADKDVFVEAYDYDSMTSIEAVASNDDESNTANVNITAGGNLEISAYDGSDAYILAQALYGFDNTAGVKIIAGGNVLLYSDGGGYTTNADIDAEAEWAENNNKANVNIEAGGNVEVTATEGGENDIDTYAGYGYNNTAESIVNADGNVIVNAGNGGDSEIEAYTYGDNESNNAVSTVNVNAKGISAEGDIIITDGGLLSAYASNYEDAGDTDATITLDAESDIEITDAGRVSAEAGNDYYSGGANAVIDFDAGGNILIDADYDLEEDYAVYAYAWNYNGEEAIADIDFKAGGNFTAQYGSEILAEAYSEGNSGDSTANIDIITGSDVTVAHDSRLEAYVWSPVDSEDPIIGNTIAGIKIDAEGEILVMDDSEIYATAQAEETSTTAYIDIDADDDVTVSDADSEIIATSEENPRYTESYTLADADVDILSGANVTIGGHVKASASVNDDFLGSGFLNAANSDVTVNALDGNVIVHSEGSHAEIKAIATGGYDNIATVNVNAVGGDVVVEDTGINPQTAEIAAYAENATNSNTADVQVAATAIQIRREGDGLAYTEVNGGDVKVIAKNGGHAEITAYADEAGLEDDDNTTNTANVTIRATSAEGTWLVAKTVIEEVNGEQVEKKITVEVPYLDGGDVEVKAENDGEAAIQAVTQHAEENDSDVLICAEGEVLVSDKNSIAMTAKIESVADYGNINNAYTGVRGAEGITVFADSGNALIASEAMYGFYGESPAEQNTAFTSLCTDGDAVVAAMNYGITEVLAKAEYGLDNNATIGVCADGDVLVAAGLGTYSGTAKIRTEARAGLYDYEVPVGDGVEGYEYEYVNTTSTASTTVVSHKGGVGVIDEREISIPTTASIEAEAYESGENDAYVGVAAAADLSPEDLVEPVLNGYGELTPEEELLEYILPGNVNVKGIGNSAKASILSQAYDGFINTAETVVCAPGEVIVYADSEDGQPIAQIKSLAGWHDDGESINDAITRIYASEVDVYVPGLYRGNGVWAYAYGNEDNPRVPGSFLLEAEYFGEDSTYTGEYYSLIEHGEVVYSGGEEENATLIIQDYSERTDCPTCPPCPDCGREEPIEPPIGPPAPLGVAPIPAIEEINFGQGGCPALMAWLANEVGVQVDIQVFLAGAFISSTDCQPCESAAKLKRAATILADEDGAYMAAMNQVFNATVPFTPEAAASIATDTGAQYALVREYIDAFVQYIAVLNDEMGSPIGDSVAYVMEKYGSGITGSSNEDMAAFVASRLESGETYAPAQ